MAHQGIEPFVTQITADRMRIKKHRLANRRGTEERYVVGLGLASFKLFVRFAGAAMRFDLEVLRTGFHTATAAHALAQWIALLLLLARDPRSSSHVEVAIYGHPSLNALQPLENPRAIDH